MHVESITEACALPSPGQQLFSIHEAGTLVCKYPGTRDCVTHEPGACYATGAARISGRPPLLHAFMPFTGFQASSSLTAAMTACRPAFASPNSICVLSLKYSSFSMPA